MNWEKIKKDYPKAWNVFHEDRSWLEIYSDKKLGHYYTDGVHIVRMWRTYNPRNLYDFFDEREIIINLCYYGENDGFSFDITDSQASGLFESTEYKTRTEAESAAFEKGFEILEERLNKEK